MSNQLIILIFCSSLFLACGSSETDPSQEGSESYELTILAEGYSAATKTFVSPLAKLIAERCLGCHSSDSPDLMGIINGDTVAMEQKQSIIDRVLRAENDSLRMPLGQSLTPDEKNLFLDWQASDFPAIDETKTVNNVTNSVDYRLEITGNGVNRTETISQLPYTLELKKGRYGLKLQSIDSSSTIFAVEVELSQNMALEAKPNDQNRLPSLWIDQLVELRSSGEINSVEQLLGWIPETMLSNFVLMETSNSRHTASLEQPRLILFGADARFIIGIGTDPLDPNYNTVTLMEFSQSNKTWNLRAIDFSEGSTFKDSDEDCKVCHGSPARPIWGSYREWPGAYGNDDDTYTASQIDFQRLAQGKSSTNSRLEYLNINVQSSPGSQDYIAIDGRRYGYNNTVFNQELGPLQAMANHTRIKDNPNYQNYKKLIVANTIGCSIDLSTKGGERLDKIRRSVPGPYSLAEKLYIDLGLNIVNDFELGKPVFRALETQQSGEPQDSIYWFSAHNDLDGDISLLILEELLTNDKEIAQVFEPIREAINQSLDFKFHLLGLERESYLKQQSVYIDGTYDFSRVFINQENRRETLCEILLR